MIKVTRLNGAGYWLNPHIIETVEKTPDTTITLVSGKKLVVKEPPEEVLARIIEYRKRLGIGGPRPAGPDSAVGHALTGRSPEEEIVPTGQEQE